MTRGLLNAIFAARVISVTKTQVMLEQCIYSLLAPCIVLHSFDPILDIQMLEYSSWMISGYAEFEPWQQWSSCSKQCGGGKRSRNRSCTSTSIPCSGGSNEEEDCNTQACSITNGTITQATNTQGKDGQGFCILFYQRILKDMKTKFSKK